MFCLKENKTMENLGRIVYSNRYGRSMIITISNRFVLQHIKIIIDVTIRIKTCRVN